MKHQQRKFCTNGRFRLLLLFLSVFLTLQAQAQSITLNLPKGTLKEAIEEIKKQTGYQFFYEDKLGELPVNKIAVKNKDIHQTLSQVLANTAVTYKVKGKIVYLTGKDGENEEKNNSPGQQKKQITGRVVDKDGFPLPGVSITVKGKRLVP